MQKLTAQSDSQQNKLPFEYFRVIPEKISLTKLISELEERTNTKTDTIINHTDTSIFYYRGYSDSFNPFNIPVKNIEIQIREGNGKSNNNSKTNTPLLAMQIIAIADSSIVNMVLVKKEFNRLKEKFSSIFPVFNSKNSKKKDKRYFENVFFYTTQSDIKSIFLSRSRHYKDFNNHCLSITFLYERSAE